MANWHEDFEDETYPPEMNEDLDAEEFEDVAEDEASLLEYMIEHLCDD